MEQTHRELIAHLARRAGFGATSSELDFYSSMSYEDAVDEFLNDREGNSIPDDMIFRRHVDLHTMQGHNAAYWAYRLISTDNPLKEKVALFWHGIFATAELKLNNLGSLNNQVEMFSRCGSGKFDDLLHELSMDPAMLVWLDNHDNHKESINENYGREILELFSMGVGSYSEQDIKECSRAFTGWTVENMPYMAIKMRNNTARPYNYVAWQFKFDENDHDFGEKEFLGETGNFNGDDVIKIICKQESTARYLARHLYHFFIKDELPVPQWPHKKPLDEDVIDFIVNSYFKHSYNIKEILRDLFKSKYFRNEEIINSRIKSPAELVVNAVRLSGGFEIPSEEVYEATISSGLMGQPLLNPTSVEGWQGGEEWINTGSVVQRINFAADFLGNSEKKLIKNIMDKEPNKKNLLEICLEELGYIELHSTTKDVLSDHINDKDLVINEESISIVIKLISSSREFQMT